MIKDSIQDFFYNSEKQESKLLSASKKIQKLKTENEEKTSILKDVYNNIYPTSLKLKTTKSFLEDNIKKTKNYVN